MTLAERIKAILEYSELSLPKYAQSIGVQTPQAIRDLINGKTKSLSSDMQSKIISYMPELNRAWLFTGQGEMITKSSNNLTPSDMVKKVDESAESPDKDTDKDSDKPDPTPTPIPTPQEDNEEKEKEKEKEKVDDIVAMVDYVPATACTSFIEYMKDEFEKTPVLRQPGEIFDGSYKVFEVVGESMGPTIPNRAKILAREIPKSKWKFTQGVVVAIYADQVEIKRIITNQLSVNNSLLLSSDNPMYGEQHVSFSDIQYMYKALRIISADIL